MLPQMSLEDLYEEAKSCPVKGRLYIYEQYKQRLQYMNLSSEEYTEACRNLASYLEV